MAGVVLKYLIVARWNEDRNWLDHIPDGWQLVLVQKDVDVPNVGREASSYFYAIDLLYRKIQPEDTLAFMQGMPFDHCPEALRVLRDVDEFTYLNDILKRCDGTGKPDHPYLEIKELYEKWVRKDFPGSVKFSPGAQFMVSGKDILKRPRKKYKKMYEEMCLDKYRPYVMERLWMSYFKEGI